MASLSNLIWDSFDIVSNEILKSKQCSHNYSRKRWKTSWFRSHLSSQLKEVIVKKANKRNRVSNGKSINKANNSWNTKIRNVKNCTHTLIQRMYCKLAEIKKIEPSSNFSRWSSWLCTVNKYNDDSFPPNTSKEILQKYHL